MATCIPKSAPRSGWRSYTLLLTLAVMLAAITGAHGARAADTVTAEARIDGLQWRLTALDDATPVSLSEVYFNPRVNSAISTDTLAMHNFATWLESGGSYPVTAPSSFDTIAAGAYIFDHTFKSRTEVQLARPAALPDSAWRSEALATVEMFLTLSPRTMLTVATHTSGMFAAPGLADDLFHTTVGVQLSWRSGNNSATTGFGLDSGESSLSSWDDMLQLEIHNTTLQPMTFAFNSTANVSALLAPIAAVPEPQAAVMLLTGLLTVALFARRLAHNKRSLAVQHRVRKFCLAAWGCLCASTALLAPNAALAQSLDIDGRFGPVIMEIRAQDGTITSYSLPWHQIRLSAGVFQRGNPYQEGEIEATPPIPTPLEIARESGDSWVTAGIAEPAAAALSSAHLLLGSKPNAFFPSRTMAYLEATANVVVPPFSYAVATLMVEADVRPENMHDARYQVLMSLFPVPRLWSTSDELPSHGLLSYTLDFDNSYNPQPSDPFSVYFVGGIEARISPVPEVSRGMMLGLGMLVLIARRAKRISAPAVSH